jgi:hypothetical protein
VHDVVLESVRGTRLRIRDVRDLETGSNHEAHLAGWCVDVMRVDVRLTVFEDAG